MIFVFIAFTSVGTGRLPPPDNILKTLPIPRYAAIVPTPAAAPAATIVTLSIAKS